VVLVAGCAGEAGQPVAPVDFRVNLQNEERPAAGPQGEGQVAWESAWTLTWKPVAGAKAYAVYYGTNEGRGAHEPQRVVRGPLLRIQAAAGTSPVERLAQDRAAGLLFTSSQLLVSVAAVDADGEQSPMSPWFPVGDAPVDGRPIGARPSGAAELAR
jgi:hypothetical protein